MDNQYLAYLRTERNQFTCKLAERFTLSAEQKVILENFVIAFDIVIVIDIDFFNFRIIIPAIISRWNYKGVSFFFSPSKVMELSCIKQSSTSNRWF